MYCKMRLIANYISLNIEFQNLLSLKVSLKVIIYVNRSYAYGGAGKDDVTRL